MPVEKGRHMPVLSAMCRFPYPVDTTERSMPANGRYVPVRGALDAVANSPNYGRGLGQKKGSMFAHIESWGTRIVTQLHKWGGGRGAAGFFFRILPDPRSGEKMTEP